MAGSFVATKTITVRGEDGQLDELVAGQSFVHDSGHFLIRTYPDLWAPSQGRKRRQRGVQRRWAL
jgi:hypothetical protein